MHNIIFLLIGIVLVTTNCGNTNDDSQAMADTVTVSTSQHMLPKGNTSNDRYVCGFTSSFAYVDNFPLASMLSSTNDSAIELIFASIWRNVIGGRSDAIKIAKDADENNPEYKYAAAKGSFTDLGNIVRYVYYKSKDLTPLIRRDNGWHLKAIALHEFAHHINGDPFTGVSRELAELGADHYTGFMMGKCLKTTLDTALLAFAQLTEENPTNGYPTRQRRMAAVKEGWEHSQIPARFSLVTAFVKVAAKNRGYRMTEKQIEYEILRKAIGENASLETRQDTSTLYKAKVNILATGSPGDFFVDSNYLYFRERDSMSIVGRIAHSNRPEYRQMVYDNFYNYMYIDSDNVLITYVKDLQDPKNSLKPIIIGSLSKPRLR